MRLLARGEVKNSVAVTHGLWAVGWLGLSPVLRGFRNRLRREENGRVWARGELRPGWEMDNVSCSQCCTSDVHFGQGRVGVSALARPAYLGNFFDFLRSSSLALTKVFFLVFLNLSNVLRRPAPVLTTIHSDFFGCGNFPLSLPSEQCHPVNPYLSRCFFC
jgi:hypothetical protein